MKKLLILLTVVLLASCSSKDDEGDVIGNEFENIKVILPHDTWRVTKYIDSIEDKTDLFETFVFTFSNDGTVVGSNDLYSETGTWLYKTTAEDGEELILVFNPTPPFDEISDDWSIVSVSTTKIELKDDDSNGNDTELLTFSKN